MRRDIELPLYRQNNRLINDKPTDPQGLEPIIGYTNETPTSLFDACRSLVDIVDNILNYVALAIDTTPKQPPDGLTCEESAAIRLYTMEWTDDSTSLYSILNKILRSNDRTQLRPWYKYLKLFLTALVKLPCVPAQTVWRGIRQNVSDAFPRGTEVIWWSFSSCTSTLTVLENELYLGRAGTRTLFSIEVLNARNISGHSYFESEDEILLLPGTYMQVRSQLNPTSDLHIIHLKQMLPTTMLLEPPFENAQLYPDKISLKRVWYRRKKYLASISAILILCLLGITLGSILGKQSNVETSRISNSKIMNCSQWKFRSSAITVAGGKGPGFQFDQFRSPDGFFLDKNNTIYIADCDNNRIMKWTKGASNGTLVAGGNQAGNRTNQFHYPVDLVLDRNDTMYITDFRNRRVVQWRLNAEHGEIFLSSCVFTGIGIDSNDSLYTSDWTDNEVKKWQMNKTLEQIVAFALIKPDRIFVDQDYSIYITDRMNHRIIKIEIGTEEKQIVAGGSQGPDYSQLDSPRGVTVDQQGNVYVADTNNHRIMRWSTGESKGTLVAGGRGVGFRSDQLNLPTDLQFDSEGNLYVADSGNHRIQKFLIDKNSCF